MSHREVNGFRFGAPGRSVQVVFPLAFVSWEKKRKREREDDVGPTRYRIAISKLRNRDRANPARWFDVEVSIPR